MPGQGSSWFVVRPGIGVFGRAENPEGFQPPEGDHCYVFGSAEPGRTARFNIGDRFDIRQESDFAPARLLRFTGRFRGPSRMPCVSAPEPDVGWALTDGMTLEIEVDGGPAQVVTFSTGQFMDIGAARSPEIRDAINAVLVGAKAKLTGTGLALWSDREGRRSKVRAASGTAFVLGFQELTWRLRLLIDGDAKAERYLTPGENEPLTDIGGSFEASAGPDAEVRITLDLVVL